MEYIPWSVNPFTGRLRYMDREFIALKDVLAKRVRQLRLSKGLSQEALAFEASVDRTYVSQVERRVVNPSLLVLHKMAVALGVTVHDLLKPLPSPPQASRARRS